MVIKKLVILSTQLLRPFRIHDIPHGRKAREMGEGGLWVAYPGAFSGIFCSQLPTVITQPKAMYAVRVHLHSAIFCGRAIDFFSQRGQMLSCSARAVLLVQLSPGSAKLMQEKM